MNYMLKLYVQNNWKLHGIYMQDQRNTKLILSYNLRGDRLVGKYSKNKILKETIEICL